MKHHTPVFYVSVVLTALLVFWGYFAHEHLADTAQSALTFTINNFGWFYLLSTAGFVGFCLYLIFSPYSSIKLGKQDDPPEYSFLSWLAMLFSAGMGIGLVFFGVAEPMTHFAHPPHGLAEPHSPEAARMALRYSFFHWCLHPWAIYAVIALSMAYAQFRRGESGLISTVFRPLIGRKVDGPIGQLIDILAVLATVCGVATSLGLGTLQINGGLHHIFGVPNTATIQMLIIVIVTVLYLISASTGLNKGILYLSNLNLLIAGLLLAFVLVCGPTVFILDSFTTILGSYLHEFVKMSFRLTPFRHGDEWVGSWTLFYWSWWIAWAPFVGTFIARISKGRTVREFVIGVLFVPSVIGALWFAAFGGAALYFDLFQDGGIADAVQSDMTSALFITLEQFPLGIVLGALAALLIVTFFVTSADSATFVLGMLTTNGSANPPTSTKVIWGILLSSIAAVLLFSGGLAGLQTASIVTALPFAVIMVFMCLALFTALRKDYQLTRPRTPEPEPKNILCPVDYSIYSEKALNYAIEIAGKYGSKLYLIHVLDARIHGVNESVLYRFNIGDESTIKELNDRLLRCVKEDVRSKMPVESIVVQGVPFVEIVKAAREYAIDLIVMGTHGRTGISHAIMGSVAETVVRKAHCPVFTVRHAEYDPG
ncbi:BCCT family transporter [Candidatus Kuenenia sp.]|uniref:glycine betaine uptake BCCT transporter n=1 Tax=Candidatus Kuenenia sp. TaxID=2499824 RepID=UPI003220638C